MPVLCVPNVPKDLIDKADKVAKERGFLSRAALIRSMLRNLKPASTEAKK